MCVTKVTRFTPQHAVARSQHSPVLTGRCADQLSTGNFSSLYIALLLAILSHLSLSFLHTYLVAVWALTNALHLVEAPTLHSVASLRYESPSGASVAQFLMVPNHFHHESGCEQFDVEKVLSCGLLGANNIV